jgi:hypothetical protein
MLYFFVSREDGTNGQFSDRLVSFRCVKHTEVQRDENDLLARSINHAPGSTV